MTKKYELKNIISNSTLPFNVQIFTLVAGYFPAHTHDFSELVIILEGTGIHTVNGKKYNLSAGDVFVLKDDDLHSFEETKNLIVEQTLLLESLTKAYKNSKSIANKKALMSDIKTLKNIFIPHNTKYLKSLQMAVKKSI